ncbi:uncharacterized protein LOC126745866 [Anthonomus grandis grandis]|uniref:uncharacterized protein LOC126745866 n=1 Tax=Anthonomus grandis grandis TaxID=2921223 RepID=UPI002165DF3F|nr:uncharacterized protein LOC126745866 [Anthonomus grandis grandis]
MNRKYVNSDMDSGLGSDEDRRGSRTKEEKQLHNQQLLSGCFIDAASLSDEAEMVDQRRNDERRQGALVFQSSIPQFSMLQMSDSTERTVEFPSSSCAGIFPDTSTPFNSIVQLNNTEEQEQARNKSPLGFYVDLSQVLDTPKTPPSATTKKNIFSMVIDFEGPKKDKPVKLSSSFVSHKKSKPKPNLLSKCNGSGSLSSSVSSVNSMCMASTSRQSEEQDPRPNISSITVLSASLVKNLSISSKSSSDESSDRNVIEKSEDEPLGESLLLQDCEDEGCVSTNELNIKTADENNFKDNVRYETTEKSHSQEGDRGQVHVDDSKCEEQIQAGPHFVKLSDLECQKPKVDINFTPRMSRSIPESHWVESPFLMSRSACYRSAPHPIEPEPSIPEINSDSDSVVTNSCQPKKAVRRLGTDLLRMFLEEIGPDVVVEVDGHKLKAHKCILASRCQYFAALLSGNWLEKSGNVISLQGFSYESVYFSLCHIYSGAAHVPDSISLVELASLSDMLGLEGLKEVVEHALKQRHCHNFHKPCAGCCTGVLEVLPLSAAYGLDDLYQKCLQWVTQNFVKVWPSRAFASMPRELREKCYQQHVVNMSPDKVLETTAACEKILATLPSMRWAEPVSQLVLQLSDACHLYHRQHFAAVLGSPSFHALDAGLGFGVCEVEDQMLAAAKNLGVDQACRSYSRCCKMVDAHWTRPFADLLNKIKIQLEQCLVNQADRLIRSNAWLRLDTVLRSRIKELSPSIEPQSRLPRAAPIRNKKSPVLSKSSIQTTLLSSSDSSRNSSPGINQARLPGGSPSLRRSLLLAAKAPQVPPSPSTNRRSTLTQPTAASQARSAAAAQLRQSKNAVPIISNRPPPRTAANANIRPSSSGSMRSSTSTTTSTTGRPSSSHSTSSNYSQRTSVSSSSKRSSTTVSRNPSMGKKDVSSVLNSRRPDSRSSSPLKSDSRTSSPRKFDSRVTSPIKVNIRSSSPVKTADIKPQSPRKLRNNEVLKPVPKPVVTQQPVMQRSGTFLKEEPTVLTKVT